MFWGTTAEGPHREELGPCSEPVLILTSPNPHNTPAPFVMTRSFQPWLPHPGEALSPTLGVTSGQHLWAARGPSHSAAFTPSILLHQRWGCLMVQPQALGAH